MLIYSVNQSRIKGKGWSTANWLKPPSNFIAGRHTAALLFWFFGGFRCGMWSCFVILVRYKKRKNRLTGEHLYGKWLFISLSLVMSLMVSYFVLSICQRDVMDEIWD